MRNNTHKSKKAQVKMGETVAILAIFFVLLVCGIVFWVKYETFSTVQESSEQKRSRAVEQALMVSFMPELECTFNNVAKQDCIDLLKLQEFKKKLDNGGVPYYNDILKKSTITIKYVDVAGVGNNFLDAYELSNGLKVWDCSTPPCYANLYNSQMPGGQQLVSTIPVSLYNPYETGYNQFYFGLMEITYYTD